MCDFKQFPETYKGFELISINTIPDCASTGIYLRHKKTGLEVFHLLNDDEENLFAFAFRTPAKNSTGAAHILEHSVFCGSQKFPLKEPFTNMMNQSVNTFLNALTYSDKTVYPSASMIKSDYYNLMDVYADAVFFPLLKKEAFMQEAHRLELNENGNFEIQGVVYNEMKGNYSSFESVASDAQIRSVYPDTNYAFDSGGDPEHIPSFSYEDFRNFHKKYYRPDNCLLFLYGNIRTEEQLDFLQEHLLDRLEKTVPPAEEHSSYPFVSPEFIEMETQKPFEKPVTVRAEAPDAGATGATVTVNWLCGQTADLQSYMECAFLSEVLSGHDGSPLTKALIDSDLGDDIAPVSGCINEARQFFFALGLHGVKARNEKKVYALIFKELERLCTKGINQNDIDSAIMTAEFSNREVVRSGGPYSLVLLERALNSWNYGGAPADGLFYRSTFDIIRKNCEAEPKYVENLIKKYLLDNKNCSFVMVKPSKKYLSARNKAEKKLIASLSKTADRNIIQKELDELHSYQNHRETEEEVACIPRLNISDLNTNVEKIHTEINVVDANGASVPLFTNTENTNGIAYLELWIPADVLSPEEYKYLPLYAYCAPNTGWNGKDWAECAQETAVHTGGITCRLFTNTSPNTEKSAALRKSLSKYNCTDRDWLIFSVRMTGEKTDDALKVFAECFSTYNFSDTKRLATLTAEAYGTIKSAVIPRGNKLAGTRAQAVKTHTNTVDEIWKGITQLFAIKAISEENPKNLSEHFSALTEKLRSAGALIHITADSETMQNLLPKMNDFASGLRLVPPAEKTVADEAAFLRQIVLPGEKEPCRNETFVISSQVGYAAAAINSSYFGTAENPSELVLSHYLSGTSLWERIRTTGGAYGAYAGCANLSGLFVLTTYRDPAPQKSLKTFGECLKDAAENPIGQDELLRMITGTYGDEVQPRSPYGRGNIGLIRTLYCISDEERQQKLTGLLNVTAEQIQQTAMHIHSHFDTCRTAVLCNKSEKITGVIIDLPL